MMYLWLNLPFQILYRFQLMIYVLTTNGRDNKNEFIIRYSIVNPFSNSCGFTRSYRCLTDEFFNGLFYCCFNTYTIFVLFIICYFIWFNRETFKNIPINILFTVLLYKNKNKNKNMELNSVMMFINWIYLWCLFDEFICDAY